MENEFYGIDFTVPVNATPARTDSGSVPPFMPANPVVAMAYVPFQNFKTMYSPEEGLKNGTIFPELNLPFKPGDARG